MADELETIDPTALEAVTGGRYQRGPAQIDPKLIQGIAELAKAVQAVGQGLAQAKQQSSGQMMQMMQEMMARKAKK
jgi:hypothetical protein